MSAPDLPHRAYPTGTNFAPPAARNRQRTPVYPRKRHFKEDPTLGVGQPIAHRGYAATLVEFIPTPAKPEDICAICLGELGNTRVADTEVLTQPCDHPFHKACLEQWRDQFYSGRATCPTCRATSADGEVTFLHNRWKIAYEDGTTAVVRASAVKRERPPPEPFNPRHKNDFFRRARNGGYPEPLPKRTSRSAH